MQVGLDLESIDVATDYEYLWINLKYLHLKKSELSLNLTLPASSLNKLFSFLNLYFQLNSDIYNRKYVLGITICIMCYEFIFIFGHKVSSTPISCERTWEITISGPIKGVRKLNSW